MLEWIVTINTQSFFKIQLTPVTLKHCPGNIGWWWCETFYISVWTSYYSALWVLFSDDGCHKEHGQLLSKWPRIPPFCWHHRMAGIVLAETFRRSISPVNFILYLSCALLPATEARRVALQELKLLYFTFIAWLIKITTKIRFSFQLKYSKSGKQVKTTMFTDQVLDHSNVFFHSSTSSEGHPVMISSHRGEGGFPSWQEGVAIPSNPLTMSVHWGVSPPDN